MNYFKKRDLVLDGFLFTFLTAGLISLLSVSEFYFKQQVTFSVIGLIFYILMPLISLNWYKVVFPFIYISIFLSLIFLFFFGTSIRGSTSWIDLGIVNFQPSELAKFALVFYFSYILSLQKNNIYKSIMLFIISGLLVLPVLFQPDFGTALILIVLSFFLVFISYMNFRSFIFLLILSLFISVVGYNFLQPYQKNRISSFLNPGSDLLGSGYNVEQSKIAIGSAGLLGKGLKNNTQVSLNFLPEPHTDFIFAAASESYGFVFSIFVLMLFFSFIGWLYFKYIYKSNFVFKSYFAYGVTFLVFIQMFLNIGMNLGLLPVTGLTLPFFSYGGSSLITFIMLLAFLQAANIDENRY